MPRHRGAHAQACANSSPRPAAAHFGRAAARRPAHERYRTSLCCLRLAAMMAFSPHGNVTFTAAVKFLVLAAGAGRRAAESHYAKRL